MRYLNKFAAFDRSKAIDLDNEDPLQEMRQYFTVPSDQIYLGANTLGAMPASAVHAAHRVTEDEWRTSLVSGWHDRDWIGLPARLGNMIGDLIGAGPDQVICADSTSVNLFKALHAAVALKDSGKHILTENENFPTDNYIAAAVAEQRGLDLRMVPRVQLFEALNGDTAAITATEVDYLTSGRLDLKQLTSKAKKLGVPTVWDLSHSAGVLPIFLDDWGVDFAVGCTYKYLSGGPGAPAYLYVSKEVQEKSIVIIPGWLGHEQPFQFQQGYTPASGISRFLCGSPPIIGMAVLQASLKAVGKNRIARLHNKSQQLTELFMQLIEERCEDLGLVIQTPRTPQARGGHVALAHDDAEALVKALIVRGITGDFRPPKTMRFGFSPLFNRFVEVWDTVECMRNLLKNEILWD